MEVITIEHSAYEDLIDKLNDIHQSINKSKRIDLSKIWLDNQDICEILKISTRTLQAYRDKKMIPFYKVGGKIYYKFDDINAFVERHKN